MVTAVEPRIVPLIVCGRKNFQNARLKADSLSPEERGWLYHRHIAYIMRYT